MKKLICILCLALVVCTSACSKEETPKENEKDKVVINTNEIYSAPNKPTDVQIALYNDLSDVLEDGKEEEIAKLVAQNFIADFYTFKNKTSSEDIGGLTYLPENRRADFVTYASVYAYANYEKISQEHGDKNLPQIKEVEVSNIVEKEISYTDIIPADSNAGTAEQKITNTYDGYVVSVLLTFEKTKVSEQELPTTLDITVIEMDDVYRVIGLE